MTIRADQISDAIARIADEAYYDAAGDNPTMSDEDVMKHAIAAALNAWPGMGRVEGLMDGDDVVAPPAIFPPVRKGTPKILSGTPIGT